MASIQFVVQGLPFALDLQALFTPIPGVDDETIALARAVQVALGTDRRALPDDKLPAPTPAGEIPDRRGWWGDLDAQTIWGGWPIGVRLWLKKRSKITEAGAKEGATVEQIRRYIAEALQPFVDARMASGFDIALSRSGLHQITGVVTLFRGPKDALALEFQALWPEAGA